jgi:exopolysaccharide biosynthesis polyprenyl glycosylphosphotransferase
MNSNGIAQLNERPTIEPRWMMPVLDALFVLLAFVLGYIIRYEWQVFRPVYDPDNAASFIPYIPYALIYAGLLVAIYQNNGLYRNVRQRVWIEEVTLIASGIANTTLVILALYFALQPLVTSRLMLMYVVMLLIGGLSLTRLVRRMVWAHFRARGIGVQRVVIVGMGDVGTSVLRTLVARRDFGYRVVGYLDDDPQRGTVDLGRVVGLGAVANLGPVIQQYDVDTVMITLKWQHYDQILELAQIARQHDAEVRVVPDIFQLNLRQVQVENLDGIPLLGVDTPQPLRGANRVFKRVLDMALTLVAMPLWVPIFGIVALAIKLDDGGDILYKTHRIGENGRKFYMYKFRSMIPEADKYRSQLMMQVGGDVRRPKIVDDPRITRVGRFIRRTSLDELPNLINVLKGEMSLVGPRPPLPDEVELYENWHRQRLQTIPGITGLWQVSGRSEVPFDEMCLMDIYYIENWSIQFDVQILLMTIPKVLLRSGAY